MGHFNRTWIEPCSCRTKTYFEDLPTASIVVPFHNEHLSVLLRTAISALNRAPPNLIEVILVDDASTKGNQELVFPFCKGIQADFMRPSVDIQGYRSNFPLIFFCLCDILFLSISFCFIS